MAQLLEEEGEGEDKRPRTCSSKYYMQEAITQVCPPDKVQGGLDCYDPCYSNEE